MMLDLQTQQQTRKTASVLYLTIGFALGLGVALMTLNLRPATVAVVKDIFPENLKVENKSVETNGSLSTISLEGYPERFRSRKAWEAYSINTKQVLLTDSTEEDRSIWGEIVTDLVTNHPFERPPYLPPYRVNEYCSRLPQMKNFFQRSTVPIENRYANEDILLASPEVRFETPELYKAALSTSAERIHLMLLYPKIAAARFCTFESLITALLSPKRINNSPIEIFIWVASLKSLRDPVIAALLNKVNQNMTSSDSGRVLIVRFKELNATTALLDTPIDGFFKCMDELKGINGKWEAVQKADGLRLAVVRRLGGLYIDSDFVVLNDLSGLPDGLAKESPNSFNNAAFKFSHNITPSTMPFLDQLMSSFTKEYNPWLWAYQGPKLLTRTIKRQCNIPSELGKSYASFEFNCSNGDGGIYTLNSWGTKKIYPLIAQQPHFKTLYASTWDEMQEVINIDLDDQKESLLFHTWHSITKEVEKNICKQNPNRYKTIQFIGILRQRYCPTVLEEVMRNLQCDF